MNDVVDYYKRNTESLTPPTVKGEPWYKFSFGKASVTEVNNVMESFSNFVQETFKMVATTQKLQNENDMNICRLIGLLAIAEANSYEKLNDIASDIKDLSTENEESARQLKELEKSFLQSIDDSVIDSTKKEEQMSRLIEYMTLFAESKTKKIRSISSNLSDVKAKLDKYCTNQDNWIEETKKVISYWQESVNNNLLDTKKQFDRINIELKLQKEKIEKSSINNQNITILEQNESIKKQNETIRTLHKKINIVILLGIIYVLIVGIILFFVIR